MDENKNELLEEGTEEVAEEAVETVEEAEAAGEVAEEAAEAEELLEEMAEEDFDELEEAAEEDSFEAEKYLDTGLLLDEIAELRMENEALRRSCKIFKGIFAGVLAVIVAVVLAFGGMTAYKTLYNPYNHMGYYNISGMTLEEVAELSDMTLEEAKTALQLPDDVMGNTYYDVVEFLVPVSYMAEMYGADVETLKQAFSLDDSITGDSTWGEALDTMPLSIYIGDEETLKDFIAEYNLGEEVTGETLWGEVRKTVNKIEYERHLAEMATDVTAEIAE